MNTTPPSRRPTRPNWGRRALLILVPALVAGGWYAWPQVFGKRDPLTAYQFSTVQRGDIEDVVTATGTLQPRDYVDVGAQVSGQSWGHAPRICCLPASGTQFADSFMYC